MSTPGGADPTPPRNDHHSEEYHVKDPTTPPPADSFEEFARATGLADLFELGETSFSEADDVMGSEDPDGDGILLAYRERTAEDGEAVGAVALSTYGPSGTVLLGANGMEELAAWLTARAARARSLEAEQ